MEEKYIALFRNSAQISIDGWDDWTETKICTEKTTMGEIVQWYKKYHTGTVKGIEISQAE